MVSILSSSPLRWSLPILVFTTIFGTFSFADKILSKSLKENLSNFITSKEKSKLFERLPAISESFFEALFGEKHLSFKFVTRSMVISLFSLASLIIFTFLYNPHLLIEFAIGVSSFYEKWIHNLLLNPKTQRIGEHLSHL